MNIPVVFIIYLGFYFSCIAIEALYSYINNKRLYNGIDTLVSIALGIVGVLMKLLIRGTWLVMWLYVYQFSFFKIPETIWSWLILFLLNEFIYYWFHRLSHEKKWLWAIHVNHHSSEYLNLTTAARIPVFSHFIHMIFWIPLLLIGFDPLMIFAIENLGFLFAAFQHTQVIKKTPLLDLVFNTPSHHRVHHALNKEYINKNYGNLLIIFDRLFGTFQKEDDDIKIRYGITKNIHTHNFVKVIFHEWIDIIQARKKKPAQ